MNYAWVAGSESRHTPLPRPSALCVAWPLLRMLGRLAAALANGDVLSSGAAAEDLEVAGGAG